MTYQGKVSGGVVVIEGDQKPVEGAIVTVIVGGQPAPASTIGERMMKHSGTIKEGYPPDSSKNFRHYLYGHPKND